MFNVASWFGQSSYVPALVFYVLSVCLFVRLPVCVCSREFEPSPGTLYNSLRSGLLSHFINVVFAGERKEASGPP